MLRDYLYTVSHKGFAVCAPSPLVDALEYAQNLSFQSDVAVYVYSSNNIIVSVYHKGARV